MTDNARKFQCHAGCRSVVTLEKQTYNGRKSNVGVSKMGAAKREAEAFEEMKVDLARIAIATGAVHLDKEDGETLLTQCNANAERHAYARLTNLCKRGRWTFSLPDVKDAMRDILDEARFANRRYSHK
jgi:hypothetical protein